MVLMMDHAQLELFCSNGKGLVPMALLSQPYFRIPPTFLVKPGPPFMPLFQCNLHLVEGPMAVQKFRQLCT